MKGKFLAIGIGAVALAVVGATSAMAGPPTEGTKGNGLPKVSMEDSWKLNIHATDNCPTAGYDDTNRRTIVVEAVLDVDAEFGNRPAPDSSDLNDIDLGIHPSDQFEITDGNACDNDSAEILMPSLVASYYDVWVKFRGKPNTKLNPVLCATDTSESETLCSTGSVFEVKSGTDKQDNIKFQDVTSDLLGISEDVFTEDPGCQGQVCDLFDTALDGYFWDWTASNGAKATVVFLKCDVSKGNHASDPSTRNCGDAAP